jgi:hypothetical protein
MRLGVVHEPYWTAIKDKLKGTEFRPGHQGSTSGLAVGMQLLIARVAALRREALQREGTTPLILAEISEVTVMSCAKAYQSFPAEASACNLRKLSAGWSGRDVLCISLTRVRLTREFTVLGPGNQGFLRQFSIKTGTPQFCLNSDVGKTVTVQLKSGSRVTRVTRKLVAAVAA